MYTDVHISNYLSIGGLFIPAYPRNQIIAANEVGIHHCYNRCVRRAFLCGFDPVTGRSFEHRKEWIQLRLELLAVSFGIEICDFALLDNHIHLILRTRPDIVADWQDREVALRWWNICQFAARLGRRWVAGVRQAATAFAQ